MCAVLCPAHTFSPMTGPDHAQLLLNCTHHDIHVLVDGLRLRLPRGPVPAIVDTAQDAETLEFALDPDRELRTTLVRASGRAHLVLLMPEPAEGVCFLVEPEILLRHPDRHDLLTPALYTPLETSPDADGLAGLEPEDLDDDAPRIDEALLATALDADLTPAVPPTFLAAVYSHLDLVGSGVATLPPDPLDDLAPAPAAEAS